MSKKKPTKGQKTEPKKEIKQKKLAKPTEALSLNPSKSLFQKWGGWVLFGLAFLLYANTLGHQFAFDDAIVISENQFTQKGVNGIGDLMTRDFFEGIYGDGGMELSGGRYRPLSMVSFALENQMFGQPKKLANGSLQKDTKGNQLYDYPVGLGHFVNILLYALTALLLFELLNRWFWAEDGILSALPFIIGLIFVTHPIHTEVVANIKSRDEILALLLLLVSFLSLHRRATSNTLLWTGIGVAAYFGAMLAKEHAFTFIVIFPFTLYVFDKHKSWGEIAKACLPYWVAAMLYFALRSSMVGGIAAETNMDLMENPYAGVAMMEKFGTIAYILLKYIILLIFPHPLSSDYSREQIPLVGFENPLAILGLLLYIGMAAWVLLRLWKRDVYALAILLYFIPLSLTTNILFNIGAPMGERFLYLPSLGFALALGVGLQQLFKFKRMSEFLKTPIAMGLVAVIAIGFSIKTITRNPDWYDNDTLFSADIHNSPNSAKMNYYYANTNLKNYLSVTAPNQADTALLTIAEQHFKRAVEIYPKFHTAMYNVGLVYVQRKNGPKAVEYLLKTLELQPNHLMSIEQLGRAYGELMKDYPNSEKYLKQALDINKQRGATVNLADNYQGLGNINAMQGKFQEAIPYFLEAIKLSPNTVNNYKNLGYTYLNLGNRAEAMKYLQKAKELEPSFVIPQ